MVGCENQGAEGVRKRDFINYPETWAFKVKRDATGLVCYAMGHDVESRGIFEVMLRFKDKNWKLESVKEYTGQKMSTEIEHEMFRQFAAHKARYLAKKKSPRGVSGISQTHQGDRTRNPLRGGEVISGNAPTPTPPSKPVFLTGENN